MSSLDAGPQGTFIRICNGPGGPIKVWHVKCLIQVSRPIGEAFLKKAEFNERSICGQSSGCLKHVLWEHISNQQAVDMVNTTSPNFIRGALPALWKIVGHRGPRSFDHGKQRERRPPPIEVALALFLDRRFPLEEMGGHSHAVGLNPCLNFTPRPKLCARLNRIGL
ncbi:hypothetical protein Nepgr_001207 [Nepenthes gracilis]|uniref:Uncharacterized protein n=1 Tax=Nepenthes gracilis TaxID=150966 RepID=A0AAD3P4S6_NEPGR|nr:hypothetical protein Nepgr_001207 [Nepenthes gracilis]